MNIKILKGMSSYFLSTLPKIKTMFSDQPDMKQVFRIYIKKRHIHRSVSHNILNSIFWFAREERLELPTPGFGDQCSTN